MSHLKKQAIEILTYLGHSRDIFMTAFNSLSCDSYLDFCLNKKFQGCEYQTESPGIYLMFEEDCLKWTQSNQTYFDT